MNLAKKHQCSVTHRKPSTDSFKGIGIILGAVNQFNKLIPDLASVCSPFIFILKEDATWNWNNDHENPFVGVYNAVKKTTEITHFKRNQPLTKLTLQASTVRIVFTTVRRKQMETDFIRILISNGSRIKIFNFCIQKSSRSLV